MSPDMDSNRSDSSRPARLDEAPTPRGREPRRVRNVAGAVALFAAGCAVGILGIQLTATTPEAARQDRQPARLAPATVQVEQRVLQDVAKGRCEPERGTTSVIAAALPGVGRLVVTNIGVQPNQRLRTGDVLAEVSGYRLVAVRSSLPFYRNLRVGMTGPDVRALKSSFAAAGLSVGSLGNTLDSTTYARLARMTGVSGPEVDYKLLVPVVTDMVLRRRLARVGDVLSPRDPVVELGSSQSALTCRIDGGSDLAAEQIVDVVAPTGTQKAVVQSIVSGRNGEDQVVVVPTRAGTRLEPGELQVVVDTTGDEVLVVPALALTVGADGTPSLTLVRTDGSTEEVPVSVGASANGWFEVTGDLRAGDTIAVMASGQSQTR